MVRIYHWPVLLLQFQLLYKLIYLTFVSKRCIHNKAFVISYLIHPSQVHDKSLFTFISLIVYFKQVFEISLTVLIRFGVVNHHPGSNRGNFPNLTFFQMAVT